MKHNLKNSCLVLFISLIAFITINSHGCPWPPLDLYVEDCDNGKDDNGDDLIDCEDPDCNCPEICDDGIDNNGDEFIDCVDIECIGVGNCEGTNDNCNDGIDNDNNGSMDCETFTCSKNCNVTVCPSDLEENTLEECQDGIDNDHDGFIDCHDAGCDGNTCEEVRVDLCGNAE